ncbi:MAG TPA: DUF3606 domain-containing protein [Casimicrobiaceae bacterium]|nr:DUF3606 domain-containing protein [Casimicrobiaceae bacterium]
MNALEQRSATISVLATESRADARLNMSDRYEVEVLCAAFGCTQTDVYVAVAMVGDKIRDVRRYMRRMLGREEDRAATILRMEPLPPLWPTAS